MPHHKSCKKRMVTSKKQNEYNRVAKSQMKTAMKKVLSASTQEEGTAELKKAFSIIDKNAKNNIVHKNNAAKKKSRLARVVAGISAN